MLSDGNYREEFGSFVPIGDKKVLKIIGSYGWRDLSGKKYQVLYTSDEYGFRASGEHLPNTQTDVVGSQALPWPLDAPVELNPSLIATLVG